MQKRWRQFDDRAPKIDAATAPGTKYKYIMGIMKTHSSITFQMIRDTNDKNKDDMITIKQTDQDDIISLCYKDRLSSSQHEVYMNKKQVGEYCVSLFHILSYDTDPFKFVQVNFPAFPCVLLEPKDLQYESLRTRLQSMLWLTMEQSFTTMDESY